MTVEKPADSALARPEEINCKTDKWLGDYLHVCDRSGVLVDEFDDDFRHCRCFQPTPEILNLQDEINVRIDLHRATK